MNYSPAQEPAPADNDQAANQTKLDQPARKVQTIELAVFLFLIVPNMAGSFFISSQTQVKFLFTALASIFNDLGLVSLVLYFIWRNREPVQQIGWTSRNLGREIAWGALIFIPVYYAANMLEAGLHQAGLSAPARTPSFLLANGSWNIVLAFFLVVVVAVAEETVFRGYLILRFKSATGRIGMAVLLSTAIFSIGHGYEGMAGILSVFFLGLVLAFVYLWRRSLVAPMVMHFLIDFTSIVVVALLR